jgi:non-ribosomal peptide synthetase component E (peptide arylation enzyme)
MKRVILYSILVLLIAALVYEGCKRVQPPSETFKATIDSLHKLNDSLMDGIKFRTDIIDSLYTVDVESYLAIQELKGNIAATIKQTKAAKKVIPALTDPALVSQFNQRYPADTVSNKLQVARPVLVLAAQDLIELDGAKEVIKTQDSIIVQDSIRIGTKEKIIEKYVEKESIYTKVIVNKDSEIEKWTKEHRALQFQNKKLQIKSKVQKIALYVVAGALATVALLK